jgi:hypothetical protein
MPASLDLWLNEITMVESVFRPYKEVFALMVACSSSSGFQLIGKESSQIVFQMFNKRQDFSCTFSKVEKHLPKIKIVTTQALKILLGKMGMHLLLINSLALSLSLF